MENLEAKDPMQEGLWMLLDKRAPNVRLKLYSPHIEVLLMATYDLTPPYTKGRV